MKTVEDELREILKNVMKNHMDFHSGGQFLEDYDKYALRDIKCIMEREKKKLIDDLYGKIIGLFDTLCGNRACSSSHMNCDKCEISELSGDIEKLFPKEDKQIISEQGK